MARDPDKKKPSKRIFAFYLLSGYSRTESARRAFYACPKTAGSRLANDPIVKSIMDDLRTKGYLADTDDEIKSRIIDELKDIAFSDRLSSHKLTALSQLINIYGVNNKDNNFSKIEVIQPHMAANDE